MSDKYAILGYPLKHTMSPPIHKKLFELCGKNGDYSIMEIPLEKLAENIKELEGLKGYNITIPHKVNIIKHINKLDASAERYHSVNCVANNNGFSVGYNTDCIGFLRSLEAADFPLDKKVLQLGCGGVGRMMATETVMHKGSLTIAVRREDYASAVMTAGEIMARYEDADIKVVLINEIDGGFDLLTNATPVGMFPGTDECPVSEEIIARCENIFDVIYNPIETKLMRIAKKHGKKTIGGMSMLVWQAVVAHEIWNGVSFSNEDISMLITDMELQVERNF